MTISPSLEQWRKLYNLAVQIKDLAPWQDMEETDVFGVEHPETKTLGFVSVMGMLGEHVAITVYLGAEAFYEFQDFEANPPLYQNITAAMKLLQIRQIQLIFGDRDELREEDRALIKQIGHKFRGHGA